MPTALGLLGALALAGCDVATGFDQSRDAEAAQILGQTAKYAERYGQMAQPLAEIRPAARNFDGKSANCGVVFDERGARRRAIAIGAQVVREGKIGNPWYFDYLWQRVGC